MKNSNLIDLLLDKIPEEPIRLYDPSQNTLV